MDIDEVHSLLEQIEEVIAELRREKRDEVDSTDIYELGYLVQSVVDEGATPAQLGVAAPLLNKLRKMQGRLRVRDALIVADRIRNWLRSQDQRTPDWAQQQGSTPISAPPSNVVPGFSPAASFTFDADQWAMIGSTGEIKAKIHAISFLLDSILAQTKGSNLPPSEQILSELERRQLIALLETALAMLKSPMAEKGLLRKAGDALKRAAGSAAEKGVQKGVGKLAEAAGDKLAELLNSLF